MPDFRPSEALRYGPSSADSRSSAGHRRPTVADTDAEPGLRAQRRPRIGCRWDDRGREQIGDGNPIPVVSWIDSRSSNPYSALVRPLSGIGSPCLDVVPENETDPITNHRDHRCASCDLISRDLGGELLSGYFAGRRKALFRIFSDDLSRVIGTGLRDE
jgi:hypothetical protein